jgi:hypothetical protein
LLKYALFPLLKKICKNVNWSENKVPTYALRVTFKLPLASKKADLVHLRMLTVAILDSICACGIQLRIRIAQGSFLPSLSHTCQVVSDEKIQM